MCSISRAPSPCVSPTPRDPPTCRRCGGRWDARSGATAPAPRGRIGRGPRSPRRAAAREPGRAFSTSSGSSPGWLRATVPTSPTCSRPRASPTRSRPTSRGIRNWTPARWRPSTPTWSCFPASRTRSGFRAISGRSPAAPSVARRAVTAWPTARSLVSSTANRSAGTRRSRSRDCATPARCAAPRPRVREPAGANGPTPRRVPHA